MKEATIKSVHIFFYKDENGINRIQSSTVNVDISGFGELGLKGFTTDPLVDSLKKHIFVALNEKFGIVHDCQDEFAGFGEPRESDIYLEKND